MRSSRDGDGRTLVAPDLPYTIGELRYSAANEMAQTLGDLLIRRTHLAFETRDHGVARRRARCRGGGAAARVDGRRPATRDRGLRRGSGERFWYERMARCSLDASVHRIGSPVCERSY